MNTQRKLRESYRLRASGRRRYLTALWLLLALAAPCSADDETTAAADSSVENSAYQLIELLNQNESLNAEVARLRGQLEELLATMKQAQERQKKIASDLDSRVGNIEAARDTSPGNGQAKINALEDKVHELEQSVVTLRQALSAANEAVEEDPDHKAYVVALENYESGDYPAAIRDFGAFLELFPDAAEAPDARYWLGEALWRQRDYRAAIEAEQKLVTSHPESNKLPDAMFLIGNAHLDLGDAASARHAWEQLVANHPDSNAARKARELLEQLP